VWVRAYRQAQRATSATLPDCLPGVLLVCLLCSKSYVKQGVLMYQDALNWIRATHPHVSRLLDVLLP
jgi:hypothetical protein